MLFTYNRRCKFLRRIFINLLRFDDQHAAQEVFHEAGGGGRCDAVLVSKRVPSVRAERVRDGLDKFPARVRARPDFHHLQHEFQRVLREKEGAGTRRRRRRGGACAYKRAKLVSL